MPSLTASSLAKRSSAGLERNAACVVDDGPQAYGLQTQSVSSPRALGSVFTDTVQKIETATRSSVCVSFSLRLCAPLSIRSVEKADDYEAFPSKSFKLNDVQTRYVTKWGQLFVAAVDKVVVGFKTWLKDLGTIGLAEDRGTRRLMCNCPDQIRDAFSSVPPSVVE